MNGLFILHIFWRSPLSNKKNVCYFEVEHGNKILVIVIIVFFVFFFVNVYGQLLSTELLVSLQTDEQTML